MKEITCRNSNDSLLESTRNLVFAEDIIKKLHPSLEEYAVQVRAFIRESMVRGFDKCMISHSIVVFQAEIVGLIARATDAISTLDSPKARLLDNELQAIKIFFGVFVKTLEITIMAEPERNKQMIFDNNGRLR
jgi:hypothetical protein